MPTYSTRPSIRITRALSLVFVALTACSKPAAPPPRPAVPVTVAVVRRGTAPHVVTANGQIDPLETARVVAQVSGLVTEVAFHEGDWVQQGQVLFRIDPRLYAAAMQQARAALARDTATAVYARRDAERLRALAVDDYVSKDIAEGQTATAASTMATVAADRAAIATAQFNLANTVITAPISGRTGSVLIRRGNLVLADPTLALVVINRTAPILVQFNVPASLFDDVQTAGRPRPLSVRVWPADPGSGSATASADTSTGMTLPIDTTAIHDAQGTLTFVDNAIDSTTGTVRLKAQLANADGRLWPGQFAFVALQLSVQPNVLLVPTTAVDIGTQPAVYVAQSNGQAVRRPVTLGVTVGRLVVVTSGLSEGERVITNGQSRLTAGARIRVVGVDSTMQVAESSP